MQSKPILQLASLWAWPRKKIRQLYVWVTKWADSKQATSALAVISFMESSFFPIPPDPLLIAMTTAKPKQWLKFALICTVASVLGGLFGYVIGLTLFETVGQWVINTYGLQTQFVELGRIYAENGFWALFAAGFSPIPYKLFTIAAGVFLLNIPLFILASAIGRGARFFLVAYLMHHFGQRYKDKIEKYIDVLSILFVVLLVAGIYVIKFL